MQMTGSDPEFFGKKELRTFPKLEKRMRLSDHKLYWGFSLKDDYFPFVSAEGIDPKLIAQAARAAYVLEGVTFISRPLALFGPDVHISTNEDDSVYGGCQYLLATSEGPNTFWSKTSWPSITNARAMYPDQVYRSGPTGVELLAGLSEGSNTYWTMFDPIFNTKAVMKVAPPVDPRIVMRDTPIATLD